MCVISPDYRHLISSDGSVTGYEFVPGEYRINFINNQLPVDRPARCLSRPELISMISNAPLQRVRPDLWPACSAHDVVTYLGRNCTALSWSTDTRSNYFLVTVCSVFQIALLVCLMVISCVGGIGTHVYV